MDKEVADKEAIWPTFTNKTFGAREIALCIVAGVFFVISLGLAIALGIQVSNYQNTDQNTCMNATCFESSAYILSHINTTVDPCTDFYNYACSGWHSKNQFAPDESQRTIFSVLSDANAERLREVLEYPVLRPTINSWERKIKDLFQSCIDTYQSQQIGGKVLVDIIQNKLGGWYVFDPSFPQPTWGLTEQMKLVHVDYWINALFTYTVAQDPYVTTQNVIEIDYGGLGMYWTYYSDPKTVKIVEAYKKFMRTVASLLLRDYDIQARIADDERTRRIEQFVTDVIDFETKLANITAWTVPTDSPHLPDLRKTLPELNAMAGMIDWKVFFTYMFDQAGLTDQSKLVLLEHDYLQKVSELVQNLGPNGNRIMNNYLTWRMAHAYVQDLSWEYVHANREFYVARTGRKEFLGTWKFCFSYIGGKMSTAFGALFVRDHFDEQDKNTVHTIATHLKQALRDQLNNANWMDKATKSAGLDKVDGITDKLGYPNIMAPGNDHLLDDLYASLQVNVSDYFQNILNMNAYEKTGWNLRLKNGVNRNRWAYNVYDVAGHFYNPWNEILVPAGVMQFPLYNKILPMYMNFGSLGTILGHEMMHSVDEVGSYYKKDGTFFDWWTNGTLQNYLNSRQCIIDYYTNKTVGPYRIPGNLVKIIIHARSYAQYAIAETYGVKQAYNAYKKWVAENGAEKLAPGLGLNNDQAFFVSYGQTFCFTRNDIYSFQLAMRGRVPEDLQVNGALAQLDEFKNAFNCPDNAKLNAPKKCNMF